MLGSWAIRFGERSHKDKGGGGEGSYSTISIPRRKQRILVFLTPARILQLYYISTFISLLRSQRVLSGALVHRCALLHLRSLPPGWMFSCRFSNRNSGSTSAENGYSCCLSAFCIFLDVFLLVPRIGFSFWGLICLHFGWYAISCDEIRFWLRNRCFFVLRFASSVRRFWGSILMTRRLSGSGPGRKLFIFLRYRASNHRHRSRSNESSFSYSEPCQIMLDRDRHHVVKLLSPSKSLSVQFVVVYS